MGRKKQAAWLSFSKARQISRSLGIASRSEWQRASKADKLPPGVPTTPDKIYADKWKGWANWLGESCNPGRRGQSQKWLPFIKARKLSRALGITSRSAWQRASVEGKLPKGVPTTPHRIYAEEWKGWEDWLGESYSVKYGPRVCVPGESHARKPFLNYHPAKKIVHLLNLRSRQEWVNYSRSRKFPQNLPKRPERYYRGVWKGWEDFLGASYLGRREEYQPFQEARAFVQSLGLKNTAQWVAYLKSGRKPEDIPTRPDLTYASQWLSWGDWLGTGHEFKLRRERFWRYRRARAYVRALGLNSVEAFHEYVNSKVRSKYIPKNPERYYKEWAGWEDFLGESAKPKPEQPTYRSFEEAREYVHSLKLKSTHEWLKLRNSGKLPKDIPALPQNEYDGWWVSFDDWLGLDRESRFLPFSEARSFVHSLNLPHAQAWQAYAKSGNRPENLPSNPNIYYTEWDGWVDWLGKKARVLPVDTPLSTSAHT